MFPEFRSLEDFKTACGYDIDGSWYPRVTKIVSIKAKPALLRYYGDADSYASASAATERSAQEGTLIHETVQDIFLGRTPDISEAIAPSIRAFTDLLLRKRITVLGEHIERRIHSPEHWYAGTIDAVATINGRTGVLDIKTSKAVYRDYNLQTAAYMEALKGDFEHLETRWILRIDQQQRCLRCGASRRTKGGRENIKKLGMFFCSSALGHDWGEVEGTAELREFPSWQSDFLAFLGAKKLWEWEYENWLQKIDRV
jgi:hypothetical protein